SPLLADHHLLEHRRQICSGNQQRGRELHGRCIYSQGDVNWCRHYSCFQVSPSNPERNSCSNEPPVSIADKIQEPCPSFAALIPYESSANDMMAPVWSFTSTGNENFNSSASLNATQIDVPMRAEAMISPSRLMSSV